jgi:hypothetical protein
MSYASVITADSPVSYWRLGETTGTNIVDQIGAHAGTISGNYTLGQTGALVGDTDTAIQFSPALTVGYITTGAQIVSTLANASVEFWFKGTSANDNPVYSEQPSSGLDRWSVVVLGGGQVDFRRVDDAGTVDESFSTTLVKDGAWHHCVMTKAGTSIKFYVDGVNAGTSTPTFTGSDTLTNTGVEAWIGSYKSGPTARMDATADEVAVYNVALTATQVTAHYTAGTTAPSPVWVSPADTTSMGTLPVLVLTSPASAVAQHFELQLDTANTFSTGNLRDIRTDLSQTGWEYWNGTAWTAFPSTGLASTYAGNQVRHTVQSALSATTWYRQVRAGV